MADPLSRLPIQCTVKAMEKLNTRQRAMGRALRGVKSIEGIAATAQLPAPILDLSAEDPIENGEDDLSGAGTSHTTADLQEDE